MPRSAASLRNWAGGQLLAAATWGIWPSDHGNKFVAGIGQRIQRRDCDIGGTAKDDSHRRSLESHAAAAERRRRDFSWRCALRRWIRVLIWGRCR